MLAFWFAGCVLSAEMTGGQFNQIKPGMTRERIVGSLGEPAKTNMVNGAPSEDLYACDEHGQIMVVKSTLSPLAPLYIIPIPVAGTIDAIKNEKLIERTRKCAVHYDQNRVVSTSQTNDFFWPSRPEMATPTPTATPTK